jgi:hypothetical protein
MVSVAMIVTMGVVIRVDNPASPVYCEWYLGKQIDKCSMSSTKVHAKAQATI